MATVEDLVWIKKLWYKNDHVLGVPFDAYLDIKKYTILVIPEIAFVRFAKKKTGENYVYDIAVDKDARKSGVGRKLMDMIEKPIMLKTDVGNVESNLFYKNLGFIALAHVKSRKGRPMVVYAKF